MGYDIHEGDCLEIMRGLPDNSVDAVVTDPPYGLSSTPDIREVLRHWLAGDDYTHKGGGFMGKSWDSFVPGPSVWAEALRVAKPGAHILCFAGTRTVDLMGIALRLGGWETRDGVFWAYGSGFPKSLDVSKSIDKAAGAERDVVGEYYGVTKTNNCGTSFSGSKANDKGRTKATITAPATDAAKQWHGWGTALKPSVEPVILARKPFAGTVAANVQKWGTGALNVDGCRVGDGEERPFIEKTGE